MAGKSRELAPAAGPPAEIQEWRAAVGMQRVRISVALVKARYTGQYPVSPLECWSFIESCRAVGAIPFEDMFLVKYQAGMPAQNVTSYHFFVARGQKSPEYAGHSTWCVDADGDPLPLGAEDRARVVAAVCEVKFRPESGREAIRRAARMAEFNKGQATWKQMPLHMICKCAEAVAFRAAFANRMRMHIAEEFGGSSDELLAAAALSDGPAVVEPLSPTDVTVLEPGSAPAGPEPVPGPAAAPETEAQDAPGEAEAPAGTPDTPEGSNGAEGTPEPSPWEEEGESKPTADPDKPEAEGTAQEQAEALAASWSGEELQNALKEALTEEFGQAYAQAKKFACEALGIEKIGAFKELPEDQKRTLLVAVWMRGK